MKKITVLLGLFLFIFSCVNNNSINVKFLEAEASDKTFLFSTTEGKMLILADAKTAQHLNNLLAKDKFSLRDMGLGNAFFIKNNDSLYLYTAFHCTKGIEKITQRIGVDIAVVDYLKLKNQKTSSFVFEVKDGYTINPVFNDNDSIFVKGFISNKKGKILSVLISGVGEKENKSFYKDIETEGFQYLQENFVSISLDKNFDLSGLSGAPAFNKKGEVVGVYCGRTLNTMNNKYYARISLFN